ncbi:hypothetical protein PNU17_07195 [Turicibacter sanguinis]|uniref:hypothetical protein n=1 Tax=Turicibacter sanguinis TaxID=154288 RepID=UPI0018978860|nr:hypothetical protein [Turicibacter sanguinis]MDB8555547.1 hypothetical protein [Turicibacter sanguinis]
MQVIEFNGLPGCGKSTVVNSLKQSMELVNQTFLYNELSQCIPKSKFKKIIHCLKKWSFLELIYFLKIANSINKKIDKTQIKRIFIAEEICSNYRQFKSMQGYCLVDQGILQAILSIIHTYEIKDYKKLECYVMKIIYKYKDDIVFVNSISSTSLALDRIRYRNFDNGSRMNFITSDRELEIELKAQLKSLLFLRDIVNTKYKAIAIDMNRMPNENVEMIFSRVNK